MEKQEFKFKAIESLSLENSFGTIKKERNVTLEVTVGINSDTYGWFEIYDQWEQLKIIKQTDIIPLLTTLCLKWLELVKVSGLTLMYKGE